MEIDRFNFASCNIALKPGRGSELIRFIPNVARTRFSPVSGTISAAIATATRSSKGSMVSIPRFLFCEIACANLKPIPQPQSSSYG